jgi:hypothetical protein
MPEVVTTDESEATGGFRNWAAFAGVVRTGVVDRGDSASQIPITATMPRLPTDAPSPAETATETSYRRPAHVEEALEVLSTYVRHQRTRTVTPVSRTTLEMLDLLRTGTGLPVAELVRLLGVSRRSYYTWTSRGSLSPLNERRLAGLFHALNPLLYQWSPGRVRAWLSEGSPARAELLRSGQFELAHDEALNSVSEPEIPLRRAKRVEPSTAGEGGTIEQYEEVVRRAFAEEFNAPRPTGGNPFGRPPEITGVVGEAEE